MELLVTGLALFLIGMALLTMLIARNRRDWH